MNEARHIDADTLNALIDDAVPASDQPGLRQHLAGCEACRREFRELQATAQLCAGLPQFVLAHAFTLGPEYRRAAVNSRLMQTLPVIRSLAIAAVLVFVLMSAFAVVNTRQGSASPSDEHAAVQQNRTNALAVTQPVVNQARSAVPSSGGESVRAAAPSTTAAGRHSDSSSERTLSGWWVASLVIGLGSALLLLAWFALDRGNMRRYGRLSRA